MTDTTPRVYVADLAAYNAGELRGVWVDATDADEIREAIAALLADSPYHGEEYAIHDYDSFGGLRLGEHEDLDRIAEIARGIAEHGDPFVAYVETVGVEYATVEDFTDYYRGTYDSVEDFALELMDETGDLAHMPAKVAHYFNYAAYARDLVLGGDISVAELPGGGVAVFWSR